MPKIVIIKSFFSRHFAGMALWPFIIVKNKSYKENAVFINHERIHLRQQLELLILPFYLWYGIEFLLRLLQYKDKHIAYRNISFEREAYRNESDLTFLKHRKLWKFTAYLKKD